MTTRSTTASTATSPPRGPDRVRHRRALPHQPARDRRPQPQFRRRPPPALRDPHVILVGDARPRNGEHRRHGRRGILVKGTLHTNGAAQTVDRIVNSFPTESRATSAPCCSPVPRVIFQQLVAKKGEGLSRRWRSWSTPRDLQPDPPGQARPASRTPCKAAPAPACTMDRAARTLRPGQNQRPHRHEAALKTQARGTQGPRS